MGRTYHVMVWWNFLYQPDGWRAYSYPIAVHMFLPLPPPPSPKLISERALSVVRHSCSDALQRLRLSMEESPRYIGVEELPVSIEPFSLVTIFDDYGAELEEVCGSAPSEAARAVEEYRLSQFTVDIDAYRENVTTEELLYTVTRAVDIAEELGATGIRVLRSAHGYHVRARLPSCLGFDELWEARRRAGDDMKRLFIDREYHERGLSFLTNFLFNEKYWAEGGSWRHYREEAVSPEAVRVVTLEVAFPDGAKLSVVPSTSFSAASARLRLTMLDGKPALVVSGGRELVTKDFAARLAQRLSSALRELSEEPRQKVIDAYRRVAHPDALFRLARCLVIRARDGYVVFAEPSLVPHLIGRQGWIVKKVEERLGRKMHIISTQQPGTWQLELAALLRRALETK
jgi:hypothetical protein